MKSSYLAASLLALTLVGSAYAADNQKTEAEKDAQWAANFKKADTDNSGGLSKAELDKTPAKAFPAIKKNFEAMDTNKDGQVTLQERDAYAAAHEGKKQK